MPNTPRINVEKYLVEIRPNARIRFHIESSGGYPVHFAVTLEYEVTEDDWRAVARYDTTGGQVHRDRLRRDGSYLAHRESVRMGQDLNDAIDNAFDDLTENYERYVKDF